MIRVTCPHCGSKLSAKEKLIGEMRKCPGCSQPIRIVPDEAAEAAETGKVGLEEPANDQQTTITAQERLPAQRLPEKLGRDNHYVICDKIHVVATWSNDGRGWMFRSGPGFVSAKRARSELPAEGDFQLVELKLATTHEGKQLYGLTAYQLARRWALTSLDDTDDAVVSKIANLGCLNREQKHAVRVSLKEQFMREVWEHATDVLEYLSNADFHSPGPGGAAPANSGLPRVSMVDFVGAVVYVNGRIPRGLDFALHAFQTVNPKAAQSIVDRQLGGKAALEAQSLGAFGLTGEAFVNHARELAREEDATKGVQTCLMIVQQSPIEVEARGKCDTVLCSYFRAREAKEFTLKVGQSLDGLLR